MRFLLSVLICTNTVVMYLQRTSMGIAIVCMVNHTAVDSNSSYDKNQIVIFSISIET
jgi:hypothetical protein